MPHVTEHTEPTRSAWRLWLLRVLSSRACPTSLVRVLHRAIRNDPAWSAAYDEQRRLERIASRASLSAGQVDLVEELLFAELGAPAPAPAPTPEPRRWLIPVGALGVAAIVAVVVIKPPSPSPSSSWTARGVDDAPRVGVRARCIEGQTIVGQGEAGPRGPDARVHCPRGALLALSLTNLDAVDSFVYVVGITGAGELRFVAPFTESSSSVAIAAGTVDRPIDVVADTGAFAADERITLLALFSPHALQGPQVARTLRDVTQRGVRVQAIDRLPLAALTARLELVP